MCKSGREVAGRSGRAEVSVARCAPRWATELGRGAPRWVRRGKWARRWEAPPPRAHPRAWRTACPSCAASFSPWPARRRRRPPRRSPLAAARGGGPAPWRSCRRSPGPAAKASPKARSGCCTAWTVRGWPMDSRGVRGAWQAAELRSHRHGAPRHIWLWPCRASSPGLLVDSAAEHGFSGRPDSGVEARVCGPPLWTGAASWRAA